MIVWTNKFPTREKFLGYFRLLNARKNFYEQLRFGRDEKTKHLGLTKIPGYHEKIAKLANKHKGKRCFVIGNGPSLSKMDLSPLKKEITIGSNGIYKMFDTMGFKITYFTMEDFAQVEDRRRELPEVVGPVRLFALYNAYCIPERSDTLFMHVDRYSYPTNKRWKDYYPQFSVDLSSVVYLGSTITYINLQLAFHLGCDPVYLIGVDHSYGEIGKILPPGKVTITEEILALIKKSHFIENYHKIGGTFGVPYVREQEKAYQEALVTFNKYGRFVYNAGVDSKLDIFPKVDFQDLFQ